MSQTCHLFFHVPVHFQSPLLIVPSDYLKYRFAKRHLKGSYLLSPQIPFMMRYNQARLQFPYEQIHFLMFEELTA